MALAVKVFEAADAEKSQSLIEHLNMPEIYREHFSC